MHNKKRKKYTYHYRAGHDAFKISLTVAMVAYIVYEVNALLYLYHVLKGKCPHIKHRPRRLLRNEIGTKSKGSSIRILHY